MADPSPLAGPSAAAACAALLFVHPLHMQCACPALLPELYLQRVRCAPSRQAARDAVQLHAQGISSGDEEEIEEEAPQQEPSRNPLFESSPSPLSGQISAQLVRPARATPALALCRCASAAAGAQQGAPLQEAALVAVGPAGVPRSCRLHCFELPQYPAAANPVHEPPSPHPPPPPAQGQIFPSCCAR